MTTTLARLCVFIPLLGPAVLRAQDAAVVNPTTVHVKLENDRVRILEAEIPPGVKERLHSHPACVVHVVAGGKARVHTADGKSSEVELVAGTTSYREPTTHWSENIGNSTLRLVIVELKDAPAAR